MEHIRQHDWCSSKPDTYFVTAHDLDNSVTARILRNEFHDPLDALDTSESEEEARPQIDWDAVFRKNKQHIEPAHRHYVAGLRGVPPYPRLSALTNAQHYIGLKILSAENRYVLQDDYMGPVKRHNRDIWQEMKETYEKEQKEYIEWAKTLWTNTHCIRALRPKPTIETVYEAEYKMKAGSMAAFPKHYGLAAHISFESREQCTFKHVNDLIRVKITHLPEIRYPDLMSGKQCILRPCPVPEPCNKHPASFVLPTILSEAEKTKSILPVTEIHKELAQYALDNHCQYVASESALRCMVNRGSHWTLPVTVTAAINPDGAKINVLVIGSEFSLKREYARTRSYRAYRHLLEYFLIPPLEKARILDRLDRESDSEDDGPLYDDLEDMTLNGLDHSAMDTADAASDDEGQLVIALDEEPKTDNFDSDDENPLRIAEESDSESQKQQPIGNTTPTTRKISEENIDKDQNMKKIIAHITSPDRQPKILLTRIEPQSSVSNNSGKERISNVESNLENGKIDNGKKTKECNARKKLIGPSDGIRNKRKKSMGSGDNFYECLCKNSLFKMPPPRSFKRCQIKGTETNKQYDVIVHCSHKARDASGEVIIEPIPEYQIDLGGSRQSEDDIKALALSLALRRSASIVTARVDAPSGDIVTIDNILPEQFAAQHGDLMPDISGTLHAALTQLTGLLPGHYLLLHEPCHGSNALLYATGRTPNSTQSLTLDFDSPLPADESTSVKAPPTLAPVLLPMHKFRKTLPCAFTPFQNQVAKEQKKPPVKQTPPPQALRWPKRKKKPKKTNTNNRRRN